MHLARHTIVRGFILLLLFLPLRIPAFGSPPGTLRGRVLDPLGAAVPNADVTLMRDAKSVSVTHTNAEGLFEFAVTDSDRYTVRVEASGFAKQDSSPIFLRVGSTVSIEMSLQIGSISQKIVVSATGSETSDAQVGLRNRPLPTGRFRQAGRARSSPYGARHPGIAVGWTRGHNLCFYPRGKHDQQRLQ